MPNAVHISINTIHETLIVVTLRGCQFGPKVLQHESPVLWKGWNSFCNDKMVDLTFTQTIENSTASIDVPLSGIEPRSLDWHDVLHRQQLNHTHDGQVWNRGLPVYTSIQIDHLGSVSTSFSYHSWVVDVTNCVAYTNTIGNTKITCYREVMYSCKKDSSGVYFT